MENHLERRLQRLSVIYQSTPLYFVTFCTEARQTILAQEVVHAAFSSFAARGLQEKNVAVGRYVIMPDHVHAFVRGGDDFSLSSWVHGLKRAMAKPLRELGAVESVWQRSFFDHIMRDAESYAEKWEYVRQNPVRAGLVVRPEDWPYQGEIAVIDRV